MQVRKRLHTRLEVVLICDDRLKHAWLVASVATIIHILPDRSGRFSVPRSNFAIKLAKAPGCSFVVR